MPRQKDISKYIDVQCHTCGKTFSRYRSYAVRVKRHYCSPECRPHPVTLTCARCGKEFQRYPSQVSGSAQYCSKDCWYGTAVERFWERVEKTDTCWLFHGSGTKGYGQISVDGKSMLAHRFAYELLVGPIPEGMDLDHVWERGCRHTNCVNPDHLEPVTHAENMRRGEFARKQYCDQGHERTPENTYVYKSGRKICRLCKNAYQQKRRAHLRFLRATPSVIGLE